MATLSVVPNSKTTAVKFDEVPAANDHLLQVNPGVDAFYALSQAGALESCVVDLLNQAVSADGMDCSTVYLCRHALETAIALRTSIGAAA